MSLDEVMESHTEWQVRIWMVWLDMEWNKPDRHDHYVMQLNRDVCRILSDRPNSIQTKDFKIPFEYRKSRKTRMDKRRDDAIVTELAKQEWRSRMGTPIRSTEANNGN